MEPKYKVRAVHCDYRASDEEVYAALKRATAPLERAWETLRAAETICIKFNQDWPPEKVVFYEGQHRQLVSKKVARAVLRLLRENTDAALFCADASYHELYKGYKAEDTTLLAPVLDEFDVTYINGNRPPYRIYEVPGGGQMFSRYLLPEGAMEADAFISVAKMKNHGFMGTTLCLKNLFGLMPGEPHGKSRHYYHHLVRMPYMLADLGRLFEPTLNIVDALVGQAGGEWRRGKDLGRVVNALLVGDHVIATDACGTYLMGHPPAGDWLTPPYHRDRNPILVAAEGGFGTVNLDEIDFESEVEPQPEGTFFAIHTDSEDVVVNWRRTMCEQALYYRDHRPDFYACYAGEYILLQDNEVRWHDTESTIRVSRRVLSGDKPDHAMWFKYVDPEEAEGEHYEVYERALADIQSRTKL